jgi:cytoskeletal protein CcmA (bactofilin family)
MKDTNQSNKNLKNLRSFLEQDIQLTGDISFSGALYISCKVNGNLVAPMDSDAILYIQEAAEVTGEIRVPRLVVAGKVYGDIFVPDRATVKSTALVNGDIHYSEMELSSGAEVNGNLVVVSTQQQALEHSEAEAA